MTISHTDFERLSAALDGRLDLSARQQLDADLAASPELQAAWQDLQATVDMLHELPPIVPPRSFSLDPALYGRTRRSWFGQMRWLGAVGMLILVVAAGSFWAGQSGNAVDQSNTAAMEAPASAGMAAQMDSAGGADPATNQRTLPAPETGALPNAGGAASEGATMEPLAEATAALAAAPTEPAAMAAGSAPMAPLPTATVAAQRFDPVAPLPAGSAAPGNYQTMTVTNSDMLAADPGLPPSAGSADAGSDDEPITSAEKISATRMLSEPLELAADDSELLAQSTVDYMPEPEPGSNLGALAGILTGALVLLLLVVGLWWRSRR